MCAFAKWREENQKWRTKNDAWRKDNKEWRDNNSKGNLPLPKSSKGGKSLFPPYFASNVPAYLTSKVRIPQYAADYAVKYYEDYMKDNKESVADLKLVFLYDDNNDACLESHLTANEGYSFKKPIFINQWWKDTSAEIGQGKIKYKQSRKHTDEAQARIEERREDPVFDQIEKVVHKVALEYDYDFLKAYNIVAKYRDPNVKKATCDGYSDAIVENFKGVGVVDHVEKWTGGNHAWNVLVLKDGRKLYTDSCWYAGNNIDEEGYVEHIPRRNPVDLTFDLDEFNSLGNAIDKKTNKIVKVHFAFDDVEKAKN